jgi:hypothetical protein
MRTLNKSQLGYVWYVDNGTWLAGPYQKKPPRYEGGTPVRFKLTPDDGVPPTIEDEKKVVIEGYSGAMDGKKLWVDAPDGTIKIPIEDHDDRWGLYSKNLKITIEIDD